MSESASSSSASSSSGGGFKSEVDQNIEIWKIKKQMKFLSEARGNGTSMISLIIPPRDQVALVNRLLAEEYGTAANIKSRVNRISVLDAITSTQQKLKLYSKIPENGLCIFCGTIMSEDGKEKKVIFDFEPFKPINTKLYLCDNKFHVEALSELLQSDDRFGFIVVDGSGALFGVLQGNSREVLHKVTVDLPKKHGRGGQSALRFARLRLEKRHNYVRKVAELATQFFISVDRCNCTGLVLAGSADFKNDLAQSEMFDQRLVPKILKIVDIAYGGESGFNQAIELSQDVLSTVKLVREKKIIVDYFDHISQDDGKYCFGIDDTMKALEMGAVELLLVHENMTMIRLESRHPTTGEVQTAFCEPGAETAPRFAKFFVDPASGVQLEVEKIPVVEWFAENYRKFGCTLEFVTDKSQEGAQFVRGFGGLGGTLRYRVDFTELGGHEDEETIADSDIW